MVRILAAGITGFVMLTTAIPSGASTASLRDRIVAEAGTRGLDPSPLFARSIDVFGERMTVGELLDALDTIEGRGVAGTGEVQVGDLLHLAVNFGFGIGPVYARNTTSGVVPATDPFVVPDAAGIGLSFVEYGGPMRQVAGEGYALGLHLAGGPLLNASTVPGRALPILVSPETAAIADTEIDFTGHAVVTNNLDCFFGFCLAIGTVLGDGVAFYEPEIVPGVERPATPALP